MLIITGVFYPEPIVSAGLMQDLATALSKDYRVTVLRPHPSRPKGFSMGEYDCGVFPFEVIELDSYTCPASSVFGRFRESISFGRAVCKYICQHRKDISFIYNAPWHLFGRKMVAKKALKFRIPYMTPVQDIYPEALLSKLPDVQWVKSIFMSVLKPIDVFTLTNASKIHTISDSMAEYLSTTRAIPMEKFVVVRNWQDEKTFVEFGKYADSEAGSEKFTFMYMGNVGPLAGIEFLFEAFRLSRLAGARLVIAGSGPAKDQLISLAQGRFVDCNIEFWDVPAGMVPAIQSKADVMLLPIRKGGAKFSIPSKLPAYMFSAKPIIASVDFDSDTASCIMTSQGGWLAAPENPESIARQMTIAFHTSSSELKMMGEKGFAYAITHLSKKNNLNILKDAVVEMIEK